MKLSTVLLSSLAGVAVVLAAACGGAAPAPTATAPAPTATAPMMTTSPPTGNNGGDLASKGQALAQNNGCLACHSIDGSTLVGPSWKGLYGHEVHLADGSTVTADDAYIHESIVDPNAKVVDGFLPNLMPATFGDTLSDSDIQAITEYIKGLG